MTKIIKEIKEEITELKGTNRLFKRVINDVLNDAKSNGYFGNFTEKLKSRINDIQYGGCSSGTVSMMIYYSDTVKFYKTYRNEIEELLKDTMQEIGYKNLNEMFGDKWDSGDMFCMEVNNRNLLAWFAYEEITNKLSYILE
jgi:hypothetical protein